MQLKLLQSFLNRKFAEFDYQIQQYTHNYRKQSYRITDTTNKNATIPPASPSFLHLVPMLITITLASCMLWVLTVCVRVCWGGGCCFVMCLPQGISPILYPGSVGPWRTEQVQEKKNQVHARTDIKKSKFAICESTGGWKWQYIAPANLKRGSHDSLYNSFVKTEGGIAQTPEFVGINWGWHFVYQDSKT
jgi:hypothetical protein